MNQFQTPGKYFSLCLALTIQGCPRRNIDLAVMSLKSGLNNSFEYTFIFIAGST